MIGTWDVAYLVQTMAEGMSDLIVDFIFDAYDSSPTSKTARTREMPLLEAM